MDHTMDHLGMPLTLDPADDLNRAFLAHCGAGQFHLQKFEASGLLRYPPGPGCPVSGGAEFTWVPVDGRGTLYTYAEVPHAIQPAFKDHLPYVIVIVELDAQRGAPGPEDGLRVAGNLVEPDGTLAGPDLVARVGIGTRMRMVFAPVGQADGQPMALPMWTLDEDAQQPAEVWRYPE